MVSAFRASIASMGLAAQNQQPDRATMDYSAGRRHYGSGRLGPNVGQAMDQSGYAQRDNKARARRNALLQQMQQMQSGNFNGSKAMLPKGML